MPGDWGGFRLGAEDFEFWQQRHDRLHDRLYYRRAGDVADPGDQGGAAWTIERLAP